ncbi:uncharacterized protein DS421_8g243130 [Arachis hypogaea]|nr:uncharacterized protein DS421_8g243130 [Arachis hypogaea]
MHGCSANHRRPCIHGFTAHHRVILNNTKRQLPQHILAQLWIFLCCQRGNHTDAQWLPRQTNLSSVGHVDSTRKIRIRGCGDRGGGVTVSQMLSNVPREVMKQPRCETVKVGQERTDGFHCLFAGFGSGEMLGQCSGQHRHLLEAAVAKKVGEGVVEAVDEGAALVQRETLVFKGVQERVPGAGGMVADHAVDEIPGGEVLVVCTDGKAAGADAFDLFGFGGENCIGGGLNGGYELRQVGEGGGHC